VHIFLHLFQRDRIILFLINVDIKGAERCIKYSILYKLTLAGLFLTNNGLFDILDTVETVGIANTTLKKGKHFFLIYKEIQMGSGAQSYMRKGFLYEEMRKFFPIYEEIVSHI
jgi:hypothetical protein